MSTVSGGRTVGQQQALDQLRQIVDDSGTAVEILRVAARFGTDLLEVELSMDCSGVRHEPGGLRLRARERMIVRIPGGFPFRLPTVLVPHRRFADAAHVQWGRWLCLYRSPATEWVPGDGMFGFMERLVEWLRRAALGTLDLPGQPLHPPVAYTSSSAGCVVIHPNAPRATGAGAPWVGAAVLRQVRPQRVDVLGWLEIDEAWPEDVAAAQALADRLSPRPGAAASASGSSGGGAVFLGLTIILPEPTAFEYPATAEALADALTEHGVPRERFLGLLGVVALYNEPLAAQLPLPPTVGADLDAPSSSDATGPGSRRALPLYAFIGSPARGIAGATERATHLAAWRLPQVAEQITSLLHARHSSNPNLARLGQEVMRLATAWLQQAKTAWARVLEQRPEIVVRRDAASPAGWLRSRRVLVLGAGALGGPIAEHCARAGAAQVTIVDNGLVHPGILVRQPYEDADIGEPKATALAARLRRIRPDLPVIPVVDDALDAVLGEDAGIPHADLIVDATANAIVTARLEERRRTARDAWPATTTMLIGHHARRGVATLALPGATGAGTDILRRLGITARTDPTHRLDDLVDDLFPHPPRTELFQPEPGCSEPTFIGSAAEVAALAAHLFAGVLATLAAHAAGRRVEPMSAFVLPLGVGLDRPAQPPVRLGWRNDLTIDDPASGYEIRIAAAALAELRAECRRGVRLRGRAVETGGLLLGQVDDACRVVWVTLASGPPPDSRLSSLHFEHGIHGVDALIAHHDQATAGAVRFVGLWHSHPDGPAAPSPTDEHGMATLLVPVGQAPRRALLLIVGGPNARWSGWLDGHNPPDVFVQLLAAVDAAPTGAAHLRSVPTPPGGWWPGGYAIRQPHPQTDRSTANRPRLLHRLRHRLRRAVRRGILQPGGGRSSPAEPSDAKPTTPGNEPVEP